MGLVGIFLEKNASQQGAKTKMSPEKREFLTIFNGDRFISMRLFKSWW